MNKKRLKQIQKLIDEWNSWIQKTGKDSETYLSFFKIKIERALVENTNYAIEDVKSFINIQKKLFSKEEKLKKLSIKVEILNGKIQLSQK